MTTAVKKTTVEFDRHARRRSTKAAIAKLRVQLDRARELDKQCAELDGRCESAAAQHVEFCSGLQQELAAIEETMTTAIVDRLPTDAKLEARRRELLAELATANEALETKLTSLKKMRWDTEQQSTALKIASNHFQVYENDLCRAPLADPAVLESLEVAKNGRIWAQRRVDAAQQKVEDVKAESRYPEDLTQDAIATYANRLCVWEKELAAARGQLSGFGREVETLRQQLLDE